MLTKLGPPAHSICLGYQMEGSPYQVIPIIVFGVTLLADLDPQQKGLSHICATLPKSEGWLLLPPAG
jgi:hypothetical protein